MTEEEPRTPKRTITIEIYDGIDFNVKEDDRYSDRLCWDEMLGTLAELTHPRIEKPRYQMLTEQGWRLQRERWKSSAASSHNPIAQESKP